MKQVGKMNFPALIVNAALTFFALASVNAIAEETAVVDVDDYAFCTSIENHKPINRENTFSASVGRVYLWTSVTGVVEPTNIKHVWYYGDRRMDKAELDIKLESTRTWSYQDILPSQTGDWYVDILDCDGNLLKQVSFTVTE